MSETNWRPYVYEIRFRLGGKMYARQYYSDGGKPPAIITWVERFSPTPTSYWTVEFPNRKYTWTAQNLSDLAQIIVGLPTPGDTTKAEGR